MLISRPIRALGLTAIFITSSNFLFADTIYLKNKSRVEGVIESENKEMVEIHLGYGTTTFHRSEIDHIARSTARENEAIWQDWGKAEKEIDLRKPEEERKWRARQAELDRIRREEEDRKKEKDIYGPKKIKSDAKDGQMIMNVLLNREVRVNLVLDSGAGIVVLSRRVADSLGIEIEKLKKSKTQVADGRWVDMGFTTLKSVRVQDAGIAGEIAAGKTGVEIENIEACIVLDQSSEKNKMEDGLLGMSFLKNFKFNADYKNGTVTFEKLKDEVPAS